MPTDANLPAEPSPLSPSATGPAAIFIIRHGEKPPDNKGTTGATSTGGKASCTAGPPFGVDLEGNCNDDSLIPRGWQRAGALTTLFDPADSVFQASELKVPTLLAVPEYGVPVQHRTYQTVLPLAQKLALTPTVICPVDQATQLATWLLRQHDQVVLVCWEHDHIHDITKALRPSISGGAIPGHWPGHRFDIVVALTPDGLNDGKYTCTQVPQLLLSGDSSEPIPPK